MGKSDWKSLERYLIPRNGVSARSFCEILNCKSVGADARDRKEIDTHLFFRDQDVYVNSVDINEIRKRYFSNISNLKIGDDFIEIIAEYNLNINGAFMDGVDIKSLPKIMPRQRIRLIQGEYQGDVDWIY
jgi:hypothetical protein